MADERGAWASLRHPVRDRYGSWTLRAGLCVALASLATLLPIPAQAATVKDQLPDLRMAKPSQLKLEVAGDKRYLRFTTIVVNVGVGPLEVLGTRKCPTCKHMTTEQFIRRSNGSWRSVRSAALQRFDTSDGHNHWHVIGMESYQLFPLTAPFPTGNPLGHKTGFCFFDGLSRRPKLPGAPPFPAYSFWDCGVPDSQMTRVGLSVGWGDVYPWDFGGQYIDVTPVPDGQYLVCVGTDKANHFLETDDANNEAWLKIELAGTTVKAVGGGRSSCQSQLPYPVTPLTDLAMAGSVADLTPADPALPDLALADVDRVAFACSIPGLGRAFV